MTTVTITAVVRLADDTTAPITIRQRAGSCQWSVVNTATEAAQKNSKQTHKGEQ
jgi:hypothetical protein